MSAPTPAPTGESLWPARIAILVIIVLQVLLNERVSAGPSWLLPLLEAALLVPLSVVRTAHQQRLHTRMQSDPEADVSAIAQSWVRWAAFGLIVLLNLANLSSLLLLVQSLLHGSRATGRLLLLNALNIWFTNIIVYALWYWELDRGGPTLRRMNRDLNPDLLFPQMTASSGPGTWRPGFLDYLFVSFTNATAFSPTDTLPLTQGVKLLMMVQASTSLLTIALVASRAVNILS